MKIKKNIKSIEINGRYIKVYDFNINISENLDYIKDLYHHKNKGLLIKNYYHYENFNDIKKPVLFNPYQCCHNIMNIVSNINPKYKNIEMLKLINKLVSELKESIVEYNSAVYFSYEFNFELLDKSMEPPWYSSICQGYALSALSHLSKITKNIEHFELADKIFRSYKQFRKLESQSEPWFTFIDNEGFLWFEKYPSNKDPQTRVLNGHIYGIMGLYNYYLYKKNEEALLLIQAAMTTVQRYFNNFRQPGTVNKYSLQENSYDDYSPKRSVSQLKWLFDVTEDYAFKVQSQLFRSDMERFLS